MAKNFKNPNEPLRVYRRATNARELNTAIAGTVYSRTTMPDITFASYIDEQILNEFESRDLSLEHSRFYVNVVEDDKGKIFVDAMQLKIEPDNDIYKINIFNDNPNQIIGTRNLEPKSATYNHDLKITYKGGMTAKSSFGTNSYQHEAKKKTSIFLNGDELGIDSNVRLTGRNKNYLQNDVHPTELSDEVSEIMYFYNRDQANRLYDVQKKINPNNTKLNDMLIASSISRHEIDKVTRLSSKYLLIDTNIFKSTDIGYVDKNNHIQVENSPATNALIELTNKKLEIYQKYRSFEYENIVENEPHLIADGSNIKETINFTQNLSKKIINNEDFKRECQKLDMDFEKKMNQYLLKETQGKLRELNEIKDVYYVKDSIFELERRQQKYQRYEKFSEAVEELNNFQPLVSKEFKNLSPNAQKNAAMNEIDMNNYQNFNTLSKQELKIRFNNLNNYLHKNMPASSITTVYESDNVNIKNAFEALRIVGKMIENHPDNDSRIIDVRAHGSIDNLIVNPSTEVAFAKITNIGKPRTLNNGLKPDEMLILQSRRRCEEYLEKLKDSSSNFYKIIDKDKVSFESLTQDINEKLLQISSEKGKMKADEIENNVNNIINSFGNKHNQDEVIKSYVKNQLLINVLENHLSENNYVINEVEHGEFMKMNSKHKIYEYLQVPMNKTHLLKFKETYPGNEQEKLDAVKTLIARNCNLTPSDMKRLTKEGEDFFNSATFENILKNTYTTYSSFEKVVGWNESASIALQDPKKCRVALTTIEREIASLENDGMKEPGQLKTLQQYQDFLVKHISNNKISLCQTNEEIIDVQKLLKPNIQMIDKDILVKSNILTDTFKQNIENLKNDSFAIYKELDILSGKKLNDTKEYEILFNAINSPSVMYSEKPNEMLKDIILKNELYNEVVSYFENKNSNKTVDKAIEDFNNKHSQNGIDIQKNKDFIDTLQKLNFEEIVAVKKFKEYCLDNKTENYEKLKETYIKSISDEKIKDMFENMNESKAESLKTYVMNDIIDKTELLKRSNNPIVGQVLQGVSKDASEFDVNAAIIRPYIDNYIKKSNEDVASKLNNESVMTLRDVSMIKNSMENEQVRATIQSYEGIFNKDGSFNPDKIRERNEFSAYVERNNVFDSSSDNIVRQKVDRLNIANHSIVYSIDSIKKLEDEMYRYDISPSSSSAIIGRSERNIKDIIDDVSNPQKINLKMIDINNALENNPLSTQYLLKEDKFKELNYLNVKIEQAQEEYNKINESIEKQPNYKIRKLSDIFETMRRENKVTTYKEENREESLEKLTKLTEQRDKLLAEIESAKDATIKISTDFNEKYSSYTKNFKELMNVLNVNEETLNHYKTYINEFGEKLISEPTYEVLKSALKENYEDIIRLNANDMKKVMDLFVIAEENLDFENIGKSSNMMAKVIEDFDDVKNHKKFLTLYQYQNELENLNNLSKTVSVQDFNNTIIKNYGYMRNIESLEDSLEQTRFNHCYESFSKLYSNIAKIELISESLNKEDLDNLSQPDKWNPKHTVLKDEIKEIIINVAQHNANVKAYHEEFGEGTNFAYKSGLEKVANASLTNKNFENMLKDTYGEEIPINYKGTDKHDCLKPITIDSLTFENVSEPIRKELTSKLNKIQVIEIPGIIKQKEEEEQKTRIEADKNTLDSAAHKSNQAQAELEESEKRRKFQQIRNEEMGIDR